MFDAVIVGAGFAGSVLARELAEKKNMRVLVVEKRRHIAGNCYDHVDESGVLVHKYGPHLFHTSNKEVFTYLAQFTVWQEYQHRVLGSIDGVKVPLPFNLNSLAALYPQSMAISLERKLIEKFGHGKKVPILELRNSDDPELVNLADFIYEKVFLHYTMKQWGCSPQDISTEVINRVPVFISRDDRYFQDTYQAVPQNGYTQLFEKMLDHPKIHLLLNTDYKDVLSINVEQDEIFLFGTPFTGELVYTGMIDELFDYRFGKLPYRTLDFAFQTLEQEYFQEVATVNYPNNFNFTRITEFKHIHPRSTDKTTVLREYPREYKGADKEKDTPSYPVFKDENTKLYGEYLECSSRVSNLTLLGRLAEYRYYDMDDMVARSLEVFSTKFA